MAFATTRERDVARDRVSPAGLVERVGVDVDAWATGKNPWVRAPLLLFFAYVGVRQFGDVEYACVFSAINLGIHEAGHFVFASMGQTLHAAGGTILQLAAPIAA